MEAEEHVATTYQSKAREVFGEVCIDKFLFIRSGIFARSIPTFVGEWILDRFCPDGRLTPTVQQQIDEFIKKHLPRKEQKQEIRNRLVEGESITALDHFSVSVDLSSGQRKVHIPCIDVSGRIENHLLQQYPRLLGGGMWGAGKLIWHGPDPDSSRGGEVWLVEFKPLQVAKLDTDYYCGQRDEFALNEWRELLVNSMSYNPEAYTPKQQLCLLTRLIPIVQPRVNIVELAPKGTGKSFVFSNLSRYVRMLSGGKVTAAVLFYNLATNTPGLLTQYDLVVFDEAQTISFDNPGEVVGVLKDYLESGRYTRGRQGATADSGVVFLGNIPIDSGGQPKNPILFQNLPPFLQESAFIDRIHGLLPGWNLPRIKSSCPAKGIAFKADFFGEVLHALRDRAGYAEYVSEHMRLTGTDDIRDKKAIERMAAGYLKLLFPNLKPTADEFHKYCVEPAVALRQHVRDQLCKIDQEYKVLTIGAEAI